jgi:hypothetical protein
MPRPCMYTSALRTCRTTRAASGSPYGILAYRSPPVHSSWRGQGKRKGVGNQRGRREPGRERAESESERTREDAANRHGGSWRPCLVSRDPYHDEHEPLGRPAREGFWGKDRQRGVGWKPRVRQGQPNERKASKFSPSRFILLPGFFSLWFTHRTS